MASTINAKNTSTGVVITPDASGQLELQTADTTRMTIDVNGNVGIGTATPTVGYKIDIIGQLGSLRSGSTAFSFWDVTNSFGTTRIGTDGTGVGYVGTASNLPCALYTNNTERMRIAADGVITSTLGGMQVISGTEVSATGTSVTFTGIPSWVKRITVMFKGVSTNGASGLLVQIGSGSVTTTGYISTGIIVSNASTTSGLSSTAGFIIAANLAADIVSGMMTITNISSNSWISSHTAKRSTTQALFGAGDVSLSGTLDRVRITTVNGTDTFDAGTINILYE